jgi:hypothetical protein
MIWIYDCIKIRGQRPGALPELKETERKSKVNTHMEDFNGSYSTRKKNRNFYLHQIVEI